MSKNKLIIVFSVLVLLIFGVCTALIFKKDKTYSAIIYPALFQVKADSSGIIKDIYVKPRQKVTQGQLIAEIELPETPKELAAPVQKNDVSAVKAKLTKAEDDYQNAALMYKDGVISQEDYDKRLSSLKYAQNAYKTALSEAKKAERVQNVKQVELKKVYAPIDGIVDNSLVAKGARTQSGEPIMLLALDTLKVTAYVDKNTSSKLEAGQNVLIKVPGYKDKTFNGTIEYISSTARNINESQEAVYPVFISFDSKVNSGELKPAQAVSVIFLNTKSTTF